MLLGKCVNILLMCLYCFHNLWLLGSVILEFPLLMACIYYYVHWYVIAVNASFDNSIDNSAELVKDENEEVVEADEDNFCKPEGLVRFVINDLSKLNGSILSVPTHIRGLPW